MHWNLSKHLTDGVQRSSERMKSVTEHLKRPFKYLGPVQTWTISSL